MRREWQRRVVWIGKVPTADLRRVLSRIHRDGAITIREIDADVLVEKDYAWGSLRPSKRALEVVFYRGLVTVSRRIGMLKTYDFADSPFRWSICRGRRARTRP